MFKKCAFITDMDIYRDDEQKIAVINGRTLRLGPYQYAILDLLFTYQEICDGIVAVTLYQREADADTRMLATKHISKLRVRLRIHDLDIKRIHGHGYKVVPSKVLST